MSSMFQKDNSEKTKNKTLSPFQPVIILLWAIAFMAFLTSWPIMISLGILHSYFHIIPALSFGAVWLFGISLVLLTRLVKYA